MSTLTCTAKDYGITLSLEITFKGHLVQPLQSELGTPGSSGYSLWVQFQLYYHIISSHTQPLSVVHLCHQFGRHSQKQKSGQNYAFQGCEDNHGRQRQEDEPQLVTGFFQPRLQTKGKSFFLLSLNNVSQTDATTSKSVQDSTPGRENLW